MKQYEIIRKFLDMCIDEDYTIDEIEDTIDEIKKALKDCKIK